jgi:ABC-2 type transport system permease protein
MLSMVTAFAVRAPSADALRFMLVPLNLTLYFTSGAIYPIQGFPNWLQTIAIMNPETYGVHALRLLMYKQASLAAIIGDLTYLALFTALMLVLATMIFRRTL